MKKIDAQKKYVEFFKRNNDLAFKLMTASEEEDIDTVSDIAGGYVELVNGSLDLVSKLILTGVQDDAN